VIVKMNAEQFKEFIKMMSEKSKVEVPISNNGVETLALYQEEGEFESEGSKTFDKFEYKEDNKAEEVEGYFIEWSVAKEENSALYLTNLKEVLVKDDDSEAEGTIKNKILGLIDKNNLP
ncbi:5735_t:CDS:2, partial [Gigaspora margarita]